MSFLRESPKRFLPTFPALKGDRLKKETELLKQAAEVAAGRAARYGSHGPKVRILVFRLGKAVSHLW